VPAEALYLCFHVPGRYSANYYAADLLGDILGRSKSSRLHKQLVHEKKLFSGINAYMTGSLDPGLLVISGQLTPGTRTDDAENAVFEMIHELINHGITEEELDKVKNQAESTLVFGEVEVLNRAMNLAIHTLHGNTEEINREVDHIRNVQMIDILESAKKYLTKNNCSALHYHNA
jgi:predicted Zn-dependent peptidase